MFLPLDPAPEAEPRREYLTLFSRARTTNRVRLMPQLGNLNQ